MSNSWRVNLSGRFWNQKKFEDDFLVRPEMQRLAQSKGRCRMVVCPRVGDRVFFVMRNKIVMRGTVESNGFEKGTYHQRHSCNIGVNRGHAVPDEFVWIRIEEIRLSENIRSTGQRTWAKMPV